MKKILKVIGNSLRSNIWLKITAVVFAFILWNYVISESDTIRERVVDPVPVSYINADQMDGKWLTVSGSLDDILSNVKVKVNAAQKYHRYISENNVTATVNLGTINSAGEVTLKIQATTQYGTIGAVEPDTVTIQVEDLVKRTVPVEAVLTGEAPEGYYVAPPVISPAEVEIGGARSDIGRIKKAVCYVSADNVTESTKESYRLTLLDENDQVVEEQLVKGSVPSAIVQLDVYPMKEVPIDQKNLVKGADQVAHGYEVGTVESTPKVVKIAAEEDVLNSIQSVQVEPIDLTGMTENLVASAKIKVPDNVEYISVSEVEVSAQISEIRKEVTFDNIKITATNLNNAYNAKVTPDKMSVTIKGGYAAVNALKRGDVALTVDLQGLAPGTYKLPVAVSSLKDIKPTDVTPENEYVSVEIQ